MELLLRIPNFKGIFIHQVKVEFHFMKFRNLLNRYSGFLENDLVIKNVNYMSIWC